MSLIGINTYLFVTSSFTVTCHLLFCLPELEFRSAVDVSPSSRFVVGIVSDEVTKLFIWVVFSSSERCFRYSSYVVLEWLPLKVSLKIDVFYEPWCVRCSSDELILGCCQPFYVCLCRVAPNCTPVVSWDLATACMSLSFVLRFITLFLPISGNSLDIACLVLFLKAIMWSFHVSPLSRVNPRYFTDGTQGTSVSSMLSL